MKHLFLFSLLLFFFSCAEKTEKTSKYAEYIAELNRFDNKIDSAYAKFKQFELDSLVAIRKNSDSKYKQIKEAYQTDSIDPKYEVIMLLVRGQLVKKLKTVESDFLRISSEYDYTKKQVRDLKENLIHETLDHEKATIFYKEERNAQIILNGELSAYVETVSSSSAQYPILTAKMDSILAIHVQ